ncbi:MAG TPA: site-specific integrase [Alphaproteobacteria bacterium]|nr:site-specific integrase [Alphaproteobacteria bacterium]
MSKRRTPGEGGLRQRSPRSWEIKFDAGVDPKTGKRLTRFTTVRGTKKDALEALAKYRNQRTEGTLLEPKRITLAAFLELWLTGQQHRVSAKTWQRYAEIARKHLIPALGAHPLSKLTPLHLETYYNETVTKPRKRTKRGGAIDELAPLSAHTVRHHHRVLSQALKQAVRLRLLAFNPANNVNPPRPLHKEMRILDHAQTGVLLKAAKGSPIELVVLIAVTTGMRRGEILGMRWKDLNLEARTLSVAQTLEEVRDETTRKMRLTFKAPKTDRSRRTITLPEMTAEALRLHRVEQAKQRLRAGAAYDNADLVCCDELGAPLRPHYITQAFAKMAAGLKLPVRFHDLRHTHISHLLAAGVHPKVASERAGHASVSITLDVYSHLIPGMQEDAANKIDAALKAHLDTTGGN